jgi:hypothetical protein
MSMFYVPDADDSSFEYKLPDDVSGAFNDASTIGYEVASVIAGALARIEAAADSLPVEDLPMMQAAVLMHDAYIKAHKLACALGDCGFSHAKRKVAT